MVDKESKTERSYKVGDVAAGARVAIGENISWVEGVSGLPDGEALKRQFSALLEKIKKMRRWMTTPVCWPSRKLKLLRRALLR